MFDWFHLPIVLGSVTIVMLLYTLITRSAGIYPTARQFWRILLLSTGISYLLSGSLFLFLHVTPVAAVGISAIVPFLMSNLDFGEQEEGAQPMTEGQPSEDEEEVGTGEHDALEDEAESGQDERAYEALYQERRESEQYN